ncbi:MAG: beta-ketoacyl synthase N-terminal-like domain-containing protein [Planctomycetota bacterium]
MPSTIVITGLGIASAIGLGKDEFWSNLQAQESGIRSLELRQDEGAKPGPAQRDDPFWHGAPILNFDPKQYVTPRKALKVMCREIQTAFAASRMAIQDANLEEQLPADGESPWNPSQIGTVFGSEMFYGPPSEMVKAFLQCERDDGTIDASRFGEAAMKGVMPLWMLKYLPNMPACHVGISVNAHGPNNTLVLGDVSGPAALAESVSCLLRSHADLMICGASGTRINTTRLNYTGDYPTAGQDAPGVIGGEGAVTVILESSENAFAGGRTPLASVLGISSRFAPSHGMQEGTRSSDAKTDGRREKPLRGSSRAISNACEAALAQARLQPSDVDLIVSHRMGDPSMDSAEREGLARFDESTPRIMPMQFIGHTGAASGMFAIATAICHLSMTHGISSPTSIKIRDGKTDQNEQSKYVLCVSHTSEGSATACVLGQPQR